MSEPDLTLPAKAAIRAYLLKLVLPAGTVLSVVLFFAGYFLKDVAYIKAEWEAHQFYRPVVYQAITQAEVARQQTSIALEEVNSLRNRAREVGVALSDTEKREQARSTNGVPSSSTTAIAQELLKDREFARRLLSQIQAPSSVELTTQLYVHDTRGGSEQTYRCPKQMRILSCIEIQVPSGQSMCSTIVSSDGRSCTYGFCMPQSGQQYRVTAICGQVAQG